MSDIQIIPTNTCPPDRSALGNTTESLMAFASVIQLDISDGLFSPVTSWPYGAGQEAELSQKLPHAEKISYEVHMMVEEAREMGVKLAGAGAHRILGHIESFSSADEARSSLDAWRDSGAKEAGLAILMHSPLEALDPIIAACDEIQFMTIPRIGAQGAPFADGALERVAEFHRRYPEMMIAVDGAVSESTIEALARAGARRFGVGSAISKAADPKAMYEHLLRLAQSAAV